MASIDIKFMFNPKLKEAGEAFEKAFTLLEKIEEEGVLIKAKLPEEYHHNEVTEGESN